jgi:hypothetical protein
MRKRVATRSVLGVAVLAGLALFLAGCGSSSSTSKAPRSAGPTPTPLDYTIIAGPEIDKDGFLRVEVLPRESGQFLEFGFECHFATSEPAEATRQVRVRVREAWANQPLIALKKFPPSEGLPTECSLIEIQKNAWEEEKVVAETPSPAPQPSPPPQPSPEICIQAYTMVRGPDVHCSCEYGVCEIKVRGSLRLECDADYVLITFTCYAGGLHLGEAIDSTTGLKAKIVWPYEAVLWVSQAKLGDHYYRRDVKCELRSVRAR